MPIVPLRAAAVLLALAAVPAVAQPAPPLVRAGQTVEGRLAPGDARDPDAARHMDTYRYRGRAGERLMIDLASTSIRPFFRVGRMEGGRFRELDRISILMRGRVYHAEAVLPADGEYLIRVSATGASTDGPYRMTVQSAASAGTPAAGVRFGVYGLTWTDDTGCMLSVGDFGAGRARFQLSCVVRSAVDPEVWVTGTVPVRDRAAVHRFTGPGGACELRFRFGERQVRVEQVGASSACGFRGGVRVNGTYRHVQDEAIFHAPPRPG